MRVLITGATGLVGQGVLRECLRDPGVAHVVALGRRPSGHRHPKLVDLVIPDFVRDIASVEDRLQPFDACLYCAGAPPVGTPAEDYRRTTVDATLAVAAALARHDPRLVFLYISGAGSSPDSLLMPLRIKGEAEQALAALPIRTVMLRTGGIQPVGGEQSPHPTLAMLYRYTGPLMDLGVRALPQLMTTTERVGRAMLALARQPDPPAVVENAQINSLGS
jgi:uncharacterized protein YbjT (DUF2867 family)